MHVFVYGTLTEPERVGRVVDSFVFVGEAILEGLHPVAGRYPTLVPGGQTPGRLLRTADVDALDAYEGVDDGLYVRVHVPLVSADEGAVGEDGVSGEVQSGGIDGDNDHERSVGGRMDDSDAVGDASGEAAVYVGDPDRLDVGVGDSDGPLWPGDGEFPNSVRAYVAAEPVRVRALGGRG